jgi:hypothetical protein
MLNRFQRIQNEFGTKASIRIWLLLVGLIGQTLLGLFYLSSVIAGIIAMVGLVLGFLFRQQIAQGVEYYHRVVSVGLIAYGIILFLGDRLGLGKDAKLAIITATTVIIFDLQFWSLSDPSIVNTERTTLE